MKLVHGLTVLAFFVNCGAASANWRDDNPNQPNGYEASMLRYHYGTPQDDGPHDGYQASMIRNRNGLDVYAPPEKDDGWGSDSGSRWGNSGGSGRWGGGGSGLGRHFRQGVNESQNFWKQRAQYQMQTAGPSMHAYGNGFNNVQSVPNMQQRQMQYGGMPAYNNAMYQNQQMPHFNTNQNMMYANQSSNYQYAPSNAYGTNYGNSALQSAVTQRPMGTLLRNSQGGFHKIYAQ